MNIDREVRLPADLRRHLDHPDAPACEAADLGVRLDAAHQIAVRHRGFHGGVDVDTVRAVQIRVVVSFKAADQIGGQERQHARTARAPR